MVNTSIVLSIFGDNENAINLSQKPEVTLIKKQNSIAYI
jgi:hypothetical protein